MGDVQTEPTASSCEPALDLAILYRRERAFVRHSLLTLGVASSAVDDAIQDVFVVVFRRLRDYDQRRGTLRAWLFGIAMRVAARQRRCSRPKTLPATLDVDDAALGDPERYVARLGAAAIADRLISAVPVEQWVPFVMAEVEGMTAPEIADALGLQVATVYTRIHRARRRLDRERARMVDPAPRWWALVAARFEQWSRPPRLAMAAFVSLRMTIAIGLTAIALAALAVFVARDSVDPDEGAVPVTPPGQTSLHGDGRGARDGDRDDVLAALGPGSVAGRVAMPTGPVAGARVCAWPEPRFDISKRVQAPIACTRSGTDGRYELADVPPGRWVVTASANGWSAASHRPPPPQMTLEVRGAERKGGIDIDLVEPGVTLRVRVNDLTGGPIEGATVFALGEHGMLPEGWLAQPPSVGESDATGKVELTVQRGTPLVQANAEGYAGATREAHAPGREVELVLAPESTITGRVVTAAGAEAVEGATVTALVAHGDWARRASAATTDAEGRFRLVGLVPGNYRVHARVRGGYGELPSQLAVGLAEHVSDIVIETTAVASLRGRVELADGSPCTAGAVALFVRGAQVTEEASIGADGEVEFDALVADTYQPRIACMSAAAREDYAPVVVSGIEEQSVTWLVDDGATVRGRVIDHDGRPLARAAVDVLGTAPATSLFVRQGQTDAHGAYEIRGLAHGPYHATARGEGLVSSDSSPFELGASGATVDLHLHAPARLTGRVVDRERHPVENATVDVHREQGGRVSWQSGGTNSDSRGEFALTLDPGPFMISAAIDTAKGETTPIHLDGGAEKSVELVVDSRRGQVRGRVLEADGTPVADAVVVARAGTDEVSRRVLDTLRENAELVRGRLALTDDEGRFRIELGAGPHVLLARRRGGGEAWKTNVEIGHDVKLVVAEESTLAGTVTTPSGSAPERIVVRVVAAELGLRREETFLLGRGRFRFEGMPPGTYVITARAAQGQGRAEVELGEADVRDNLTIALVPGPERAGRLVDLETGEPIEGVYVGAGSSDDALMDVAQRVQLLMDLGDSKSRSDRDGRFQTAEVVGDRVRLVVLPGDYETSVYGVAVIELPASGSLPELPLPKLRVAKGSDIGTLGLELTARTDGFCTATPRVEAVSGPALAAGVKIGDAVTAIDGHDVEDWRCHLAKTLLTVTPGTTVRITLARGETVALVATSRTK
jgi:RNA polymerase sigma-70 factor (ECF subfamily)